MYREEAGGITVEAWVIREIRPTWPIKRYQAIVDAAERLGPAVVKYTQTSALLWIDGKSPNDPTLATVRQVLCTQYDQNRHHRLTTAQVRRTLAHLVVPTSRHEKRDAEIRALKEKVRLLKEQIVAAGMVPCVE
jgi:hypothetical protein